MARFCSSSTVGYLLMFTAASGQTIGKMARRAFASSADPDSSGSESPDAGAGQLSRAADAAVGARARRRIPPRPRAVRGSRCTIVSPIRASSAHEPSRRAAGHRRRRRLRPIAPGTVGSAVGVVIYFLTTQLAALWQIGLLAAISVVGVWAATVAARHFGREDPGPVVIDEVAGQLRDAVRSPASASAARSSASSSSASSTSSSRGRRASSSACTAASASWRTI